MSRASLTDALRLALKLPADERAVLARELLAGVHPKDAAESLSDADAVEAVASLAPEHWANMCACEIAELGIADVLTEQPESAAELAGKVGADAGALHRALRLISTYGWFIEDPDGRFRHSPMSRVLRIDHPQSQRDWLRVGRSKLHMGIVGALGHSLRTGCPAAEIPAPEGVFSYFAAHPDEALVFDGAMTARSHKDIAAVIQAYDFPIFHSIADIGGGRGHLLEAVLAVAPNAKGVLFDLPYSIEAARSLVSERIALQAGDFFKDPLPACEAYLLKSVIHDWSDKESIAILKAVERSAPPNATVLLLEAELPSGPEAHPAKGLHMMMLGWSTGRERTASEYEALLVAAGFRLQRIIRASKTVSIFEAKR
jgi:hypothetical protein